MQVQKPTVLDAARVAAEFDRLRHAKITKVWRNPTGPGMWLELANPEVIISYRVEKQYAYMGLADNIPNDAIKTASPLTRAILAGASQWDSDRIIILKLLNEDRLGRKQENCLIMELIPNKGNAFFVDHDLNIKWSLREYSANIYSPPAPLKKMTILNLNERDIIETTADPSKILQEIYGISQRDIKNINNTKDISRENLIAALKEYLSTATTPGPAWLIIKENKAVAFSLVEPILDSDEKVEKIDSALKMYDTYYGLAAKQESQDTRAENLLGILHKEIARKRATMEDIESALKEAGEAEKYRNYGDLILANINELKRGLSSARLKNFEGRLPEFIEINLDPSKSVTANAEGYFKKYRKAVSSIKILTRRLESTKHKLELLKTILADHAEDPESLEVELIKEKIIIKRSQKSFKKQVAKRVPYRTFKAPNGWEILVGKSNKDNDELTFKIAGKNDYWFHAWQAAGSHTVLRLPDKNAVPDKQSLLEAASLAAYFSKARTSSKVPVAYTQVKFVHKPRNFPPGKVIVEKEKQLMVRPAKIDDSDDKND